MHYEVIITGGAHPDPIIYSYNEDRYADALDKYVAKCGFSAELESLFTGKVTITLLARHINEEAIYKELTITSVNNYPLPH